MERSLSTRLPEWTSGGYKLTDVAAPSLGNPLGAFLGATAYSVFLFQPPPLPLMANAPWIRQHPPTYATYNFFQLCDRKPDEERDIQVGGETGKSNHAGIGRFEEKRAAGAGFRDIFCRRLPVERLSPSFPGKCQ